MSEALPRLTPDEFDAFFAALHGHRPFRWQSMLLDRCVGKDRWPDLIDLPTASGKTACIDVAVFLLALQADRPPGARTAARRLWFVVDRRIVVDEAHERARGIAEALRDPRSDVIARVAGRLRHVGGTSLPLAVARLRGGVPRQVAWSYHPAQPAIITSTVDQVGSRLLFRGYGVGRGSWAVHAALAGMDGLIVLDEAHTARAFGQTAEAIRGLRAPAAAGGGVMLPFGVVTMSATPPPDGRRRDVFPPPELRGQVLGDEELQRRLRASKPAELVQVGMPSAGPDPLVEEAVRRVEAFRNGGRRRIAVMVNRVATAHAVADELRATWPASPEGGAPVDVVLLTGRMRPVDRDRLVGTWSATLKSGSKLEPARPVVLVTTQCLEVGADFSFDALVTECASLDALRQRFGRLNRLGRLPESPAAILIREEQLKPKVPDPVYDGALPETWRWLLDISVEGLVPQQTGDPPKKRKGKAKPAAPPVIDMGVEALGRQLAGADLGPMLAPSPDAPVLLPAYLDLWCQTGPTPAVEPEVSLFLHGPQRGRAEVSVVFRDDLPPLGDDDDGEAWLETIALLPPMPGEKLAVPLWRARKWLAGGDVGADRSSDVEAEPPEDADGPAAARGARFVVFRGRSDVAVESDPQAVRVGDTIVVPAPAAFPKGLGTPGPDPAAVDVHDEARLVARAERVWRVRPGHAFGDAVVGLATAEQEEFDRAALLDAIGAPARSLVLSYPDGSGRIVIAAAAAPDGQEEPDPFELDELELLGEGDADEHLLARHTQRVAERARRFAGRCVDPATARAVARAAELHDLGKADERFQRCLADGRRFGADAPLAKSRVAIGLARWRQLQEISGLPEGFRHEMLSVQLAARKLGEDAAHRDLILHLIASHHGHGRPFAPVCVDGTPPDVRVDGCHLSAAERNGPPPHRLDSGVADRFWRLTREHGWWGLAYLEALLRLADRRASKEAEEADDGRT